MKTVLASVAFFLGGFFLGRRKDPVYLDLITGKRFYINEKTRADHEQAWRDLEEVDSV